MAICRNVEDFLYPNSFLEVFTLIYLHILHIYEIHINPYYKRICNVEKNFYRCSTVSTDNRRAARDTPASLVAGWWWGKRCEPGGVATFCTPSPELRILGKAGEFNPQLATLKAEKKL